MIATTTWRHNFTNYSCIDNINESGRQHLEIYQPLATHKLKLLFNNLYDEVALNITSLVIYVDPDHKQTVTLNGADKFRIEPRLSVWSDWIDIDLTGNQFLQIDLTSPNKTIHSVGMTIANDLVKTSDLDQVQPKYFFGISAIRVQTSQTYEKLAFFGDSLTNQGNFTAPLAIDLESHFNLMTANFGISGNRLLRAGHSTSKWSTSFGEAGFTRFDHMLARYRPNTVIFMEGINDLLHPGTGTPIEELPSADAVLSAIKELKSVCRKNLVTFVPMTITPFAGNINGNVAGWSPEKEQLRLEINQGLLKLPHIIDIASFVGNKGYLKPEFDCGDHVHFSKQGGQLVAQYIEEQLIRKKMI